MDTAKLNSFIRQGENESVDFKRELNLEATEQKAEFVKDIISLANSAKDIGFLIVGIDKNLNFIGINLFEEERIQQIVHTYIYPNVVVRCYTIEVDSFLIGVVEVQGTERPHRVIKSIDRLSVNDVFIRHGSTIAKASPDEMFRMRKKLTETEAEVQVLCDSARKHISLGNIDQAIADYSKAIVLMPKSEVLLARGRARMMGFELDPSNFLSGSLCVPLELGVLALKDFSDALQLDESSLFEKDIKLARLELLSICPITDSCWDQDFAWAEENTNDLEYGRVLLFAALRMNMYAIWAGEGWDADRIINYMDRAIEIGLENPKAYYIRAGAHHSNQNLGLALKDINFAYGLARNNPRLVRECLKTRAGILKSMGQYEAAYEDIKVAQGIDLPDNKTAEIDWMFLGDIHRLTDDIYRRVVIQWMLKSSPDEYLDLYKFILQVLILHEGLPKTYGFVNDKRIFTVPGNINIIEKELPMLAPILKKIIGKEIWQAASEGRGYSLKLEIPPKIIQKKI